MLFSAHYNQKTAWCLGVAGLGGAASDGGTCFCTCFQKILFFLCGSCPATSLASGSTGDLPWLPSELGGAQGGHCHRVPRGSALQTTLSFCV